MVAPPDQPETVRCEMCGKTNPAAAEVCEQCGARLRPLIMPPDSGDAQPAPERPQPAPPPSDPLSDLESLFREDAQDTAISQGKKPTKPFSEPEPDFTFGAVDAPDDAQQPLEDILDEIPAWSPEPAESAPPPPAISTDDMLDQLREATRPATTEPAAPLGGVPDWLAAEAPPAPPVAEPPQPEPEAPPSDIPDWLSAEAPPTPPVTEPPQPEPEAPLGDLPDWLATAEAPPAPPVAEPPQLEPEAPPSDLPDWLATAEAPPAPPAAEAPQPEPEALPSDAPDWLAAAETPPAPPVVEPPQPKPEAPTGDLPDWLAAAKPAGPLPIAQDTPDWLSAAAKPAEPPPPEPSGAPDWLPLAKKEMEPPPVPSPTPAEPPAPPAAPTAMPDWLSEAVSPAAAPATDQPVTPAKTSEDLPASWLAGVEAPEGLPLGPAETPGEAPDWLSEAMVPPAEPTGAEAEGEPDWLTGISIPDTAPEGAVPDWLSAAQTTSPPPEAPVPTQEVDADELLSWLDTVSVAPEDGELQLTGEEDLLGLDEVFKTPGVQQPQDSEQRDVVESEALPIWLRPLKPGEVEAPPEEALPVDVAPELLEQIGDLRFDMIASTETVEAQPEKVGALKNVTGVIQPEVLFEGQTLQAGDLIDEMVITKEQDRRIKHLQELMEKEAEGIPVSGRKQVVPIVRWLVVLLLLTAIVAPSILGISLLPEPARPSGGPVIDAHQAISELSTDATVLMVFDYEPDTAAEMQPLAEAFLAHLATREDIAVYAISTRTTGPAMADAAFQSVPSDGVRVNLGYVAGGTNGISSLAIGSIAGVPSSLEFDYLGNASGVTATRLADMPLDLIIVLPARAEDLRNWVEQVGAITGKPMIAAMSAGSAPMAYPYQQSTQLVAVLSGINDAVAYRAVGKGQPSQTLSAIWNAQATGGMVTTVLIILGGVLYSVTASRRQE